MNSALFRSGQKLMLQYLAEIDPNNPPNVTLKTVLLIKEEAVYMANVLQTETDIEIYEKSNKKWPTMLAELVLLISLLGILYTIRKG